MIIFDDDHFYMANVLAEKLRQADVAVTLVTPAADIAAFTRHTLEFERIYRRMAALEVEMRTNLNLVGIESGIVSLADLYTGAESTLEASSVVLVTARTPNDALYRELSEQPDGLEAAGIKSVTAIGDCHAPSAIVHAVYAGHRFAQELDVPAAERLFRRDRPVVVRDRRLHEGAAAAG